MNSAVSNSDAASMFECLSQLEHRPEATVYNTSVLLRSYMLWLLAREWKPSNRLVFSMIIVYKIKALWVFYIIIQSRGVATQQVVLVATYLVLLRWQLPQDNQQFSYPGERDSLPLCL